MMNINWPSIHSDLRKFGLARWFGLAKVYCIMGVCQYRETEGDWNLQKVIFKTHGNF